MAAISKSSSNGRLPRSGSKMDMALNELNEKDTLDYRVQAHRDDGEVLSLWHDVPLTSEEVPGALHFICEIPRCSRKKYEIATDEAGTPIKQDEKKGKLREFKKGDILFNYGCFPRTWEDPDFIHPDLREEGVGGDNDPLDVCEIGLRICEVGEVRAVKVLGVLCMIDDGEADWKVVVIDAADPWAPLLNDIEDVDIHLPNILHNIREWFRTYKIPDGKPPNVFGLQERFMNASYAMNVVSETHDAWKELVISKNGEKLKHNLSVPDNLKNRLDDMDIQRDTGMVKKLSSNSLAALDEASSNPAVMLGAGAAGDDEAPSF
mmetsp:Transcript_110243/g.321057  ORF Transcript_110243/g.321057 Transcript_110243/m.321057 type:complete len:320 (+) Transcript_110243:44-1003(+)